jgi:hypothetical protein
MALFTSYLSTSFELNEEPGLRAVSLSDGCMCDFCRGMIAASHLEARKLGDRDKGRVF